MNTGIEPDSRARILDSALSLMSEQGVTGTSMRQLAADSGLNVATLYHYFGSKADLLRAVISERGLFDRMSEQPPIDLSVEATPAERLEQLISWLWTESVNEEVVWRLLVGEGLRGDDIARASAEALVAGLDGAITRWVSNCVPELADPALAARSIQLVLFALIVEQLALGPNAERVATRIADTVGLLAPR